MVTVKKRANAVDLKIGRKIRELRVSRGLSQTAFAEKIGVSYQQAHKYEKGTNRVAASKLMEIAETLEVPIGLFFDTDQASAPSNENSRMDLDVARKFRAIPSERHRAAVHFLIRMLAGE